MLDAQRMIQDLKDLGTKATYLPERRDAAKTLVGMAFPGDTILLMGARDPSLGEFARETLAMLKFSCRCD